MYKSKDPIIINGWKKDWGGRGIAILNQMETFEVPSNTENLEVISTRDKLNVLKGKYRSNIFYQSLSNQIRKGEKLSLNQVQAIEKDYRIKIKEMEVNSAKSDS